MDLPPSEFRVESSEEKNKKGKDRGLSGLKSLSIHEVMLDCFISCSAVNFLNFFVSFLMRKIYKFWINEFQPINLS
jgi:hypothetical protein